jgi:CubicO group peptidase (beta-lactamase class C family)
MSLRTGLFLVLLLCCSPAVAQLTSSQTKAVDELVMSYTSEHHVPGLSIAIVQQGRVVMTKGYGFADIENNVAATADTVFRIASLSKSITASAVMKLVELGKIDPDAPIQKYCPAFPQKPWPITTRELLSHQSGIRDYRNEEETVNARHYTSINQALAQFANDPLDFEPGTKMQYTSYGYIVLGCVIEGAIGTTYDRYMSKAVFGPAQMPATRLDDVFAIIPHRARGYGLSSNGEVQNAEFVDVSNKPPGSGINSTVRDMGNFMTALYSAKLVTHSTLEQMLTPARTRDGKATIYGIGFFIGGPIGVYKGLKEAGHGGDQQGFSSILYLLPEKQFGVVILSNMEAPNISTDYIGLSRKIYDIVSAR